MWQIGVGRADITTVEEGTEMLGWAMPRNRVADVAQPLFARAVVLHDPDTGHTVAMACIDLAMVSHSIYGGVLGLLAEDLPEAGLSQHNLAITATHTHSGPGGYSHDLFYTLTTPGFRPTVLARIVSGVAEAIEIAWRRKVPGVVRMARRPIPEREPVAFNRSWQAYNENPGVAKVTEETRHRAVNRDMTLLRFEDADGGVIGAWTWFPVHCTSVHSDNRWIHSDNKGVAANLLEELGRTELDNPEFVGVFAQGAAGDVSPNFRYCADRKMNVGMYDDDFQSARFNGAIQFDHARRLLAEAAGAPALSGPLDGAGSYVDFRDAQVDPRFAFGQTGRRTSYARLGMPFLEGTDEGPGPLHGARAVNVALREAVRLRKRLSRRVRGRDGLHDSHGPMYPFLENGRGGRGKAFGAFNMGVPILPDWIDPTVGEVRRLSRAGAMGDRPWTPNVLPAQLLRIGPLAIAGLPCEPTTMAGRTLDAQLRASLEGAGVTHVVTPGYTNGYAGYLTTWHEYQLQRYEGGSTYFGQWTLGAWQTRFDALARALRQPRAERRVPDDGAPCRVTEHELAARIEAPQHFGAALPFMR